MPSKNKTRMTSLGYRSGFEERIASSLEARGSPFAYEPGTVKYLIHRYTRFRPDFVLPNGIVIEAKGWFQSADRTKHLRLREEHPQIDLRFVFQNSRQLLSKASKTSYGLWADKYGFKYAHKDIPDEWLTEDSESTRISKDYIKGLGWLP